MRALLPCAWLLGLAACVFLPTGSTGPSPCDRNTLNVETAPGSFSAKIGESETQTLTLYQGWCGGVALESIAITGSQSFAVAPYTADGGEYFDPYNLGIQIVFTPTDPEPQQASLTLTTSSAIQPTLQFTLTGQGSGGRGCKTDADCFGGTSCNGTYCLPGFCAAGFLDAGPGGRACAPESFACPVGAAWRIVDETSDPHNCGGCGVACPVGEGCSGGQCGSCPGYRLGPEKDYTIRYPGFAPGETVAIEGLVLGDFDGDGRPDLLLSVAAGSFQPYDLALLFANDGDGGFAMPPRLTSAAPGSMQVGDFHGDCALDVAVAGTLLLGDGHGNFPSRNCAFTDANTDALVADENGDGLPDLVFGASQGRTSGSFVALGDGRGGLTALDPFGPTFYRLTSGDFSGNGSPDIVGDSWSAGFQLGCYLPEDGGQLALDVQYGDALGKGSGSFPVSMVAGDVFGRGHAALAYGEAETGEIIAIPDPATGSAGALRLGVDAGVTGVALGDLDLDGAPDVIAAEGLGEWGGSGWTPVFAPDAGFALDVWTGIAGNAGQPAAGALQSVSTPGPASLMQVADVDGDGIPDVVAVGSYRLGGGPSVATVTVFLGTCPTGP